MEVEAKELLQGDAAHHGMAVGEQTIWNALALPQ
jgi:hypothetical protein